MSDEIVDGVPAFPCGLSLRDYFAGQALVGNLAYSLLNPMTGNWQENSSVESLAIRCYEIADAMLKERMF